MNEQQIEEMRKQIVTSLTAIFAMKAVMIAANRDGIPDYGESFDWVSLDSDGSIRYEFFFGKGGFDLGVDQLPGMQEGESMRSEAVLGMNVWALADHWVRNIQAAIG